MSKRGDLLHKKRRVPKHFGVSDQISGKKSQDENCGRRLKGGITECVPMSIVYAGLALFEICVLFASAIGILVLAARWIARWIIGDLSAEIPEMQKGTPPRASS